jgi:hypothetical protein
MGLQLQPQLLSLLSLLLQQKKRTRRMMMIQQQLFPFPKLRPHIVIYSFINNVFSSAVADVKAAAIFASEISYRRFIVYNMR